MPPRRKGQQLTMREHGFVVDLIKGKHIRKAVEKNYNTTTKQSAQMMGNTLLHNPRIQYAILDLMDKSGMGDQRLVEKLKSFIFDATKQVLDKDGQVVELKDNQTAIKAFDIAMKIKGAYAPERHEIANVNLNIYQDLTDDELTRRLQLIETREALLASGTGEAAG